MNTNVKDLGDEYQLEVELPALIKGYYCFFRQRISHH